jgi:hypothetical protein
MWGAAPPEADCRPRRTQPSHWFLVVYVALAIWATWPLARHLTTHIPLGSEAAVTAPVFNLWTVWWNGDRLQHGLAGYWDAPIFHPEKDTFAFSEAQPTTLLVSPLVWLFDTPMAAYNVYLLLSLTLNGWFGARLLSTIYGRPGPALVGGAMLEMLPFVHWQLGVVQTVPFWGALWAIQAVWQFGQVPRIRTGVSAGVAFAATYLTCNYTGLFFVLLLVPSAGFLLGKQLREPKALLRLLPGALLSILVVLPVVVAQLRVTQDSHWGQDLKLVRALSTEAGDFTATPWPQLLPLGDFAADNRRHAVPLSPGYVKYALAVIGLVAGACMRRHRRWTAFCITLGIFAVLLSMGPKFKVGSFVPYLWLIDAVPGLASLRSVFRATVFVQASVAMLAAGGLLALVRLGESAVDRILHGRHSSETTRTRWHWAVSILVVVGLGGCAVFEVYRASPRLYRLPDVQQQQGWISWLEHNTEPDEPIVTVPLTTGGRAWEYEKTTLELYNGIFHRRPLANGYSSFYPDRFLQLMSTMYHSFPGSAALRALEDRGLRVLVVRRGDLRPGRASLLERSTELERV